MTGWVRNLEDGRVEAVFERDEESVNGLEEFCRKKPLAERVDCRRLLGKIFRQFWRFSSKMRLGVCSLEILNSFLWNPEMRSFSSADVFSSDSADYGGDLGEVVRAQKLARFYYHIFIFLFEAEHILKIFWKEHSYVLCLLRSVESSRRPRY